MRGRLGVVTEQDGLDILAFKIKRGRATKKGKAVYRKSSILDVVGARKWITELMQKIVSKSMESWSG